MGDVVDAATGVPTRVGDPSHNRTARVARSRDRSLFRDPCIHPFPQTDEIISAVPAFTLCESDIRLVDAVKPLRSRKSPITRKSMKIPALLPLLGAIVALSSPIQAADTSAASRSDRWVQSYYQNPRPADFLTAVHSMSRDGVISGADRTAQSIGFFATVFAQNPQQVNYWLSQTSDLPEADRRVLAAAAWQAGHPRGARLLREMSTNSSAELRQEIAGLLERGAKPVSETPVLLLAVLSAFGSGERNLSSSARYSLAQNAARHGRVLEICRAQLDKQPEPLREELRAALNAATTRSNGS
jgi:hypothetical protein